MAFEQRENTIRIETIRQSVALKSFRLQAPKAISNYEDVKTYPANVTSGSKEAIVIEGEQFSLKTPLRFKPNTIGVRYPSLSRSISFDLIR